VTPSIYQHVSRRSTVNRKGVKRVNLDDKRYYRLGVAAVVALWLLVLVHIPLAGMNLWWLVAGMFGGGPGGD
jgi:hypothetical protein